MTRVLLIQLPIPQLNYGRRSGNIPLGAACLKQAAAGVARTRVDILDERVADYVGDAALVEHILAYGADIVGFTVYAWNLRRSQYLAGKLKERHPLRIVFGGPEITPDNLTAQSEHVDFYVCGEGEAVFRRLLTDSSLWSSKTAAESAAAIFSACPSPYPLGYPQTEIEDLMLLETQRGCPYRCGFCFYSKAQRGVSRKKLPLIVAGIRWAVEQGIPELFLLDPSLNVRPDLKRLLKEMARLNPQRTLSVLSEIRAESIDAPLAELLAAAGFTWVEIGLQSTNPGALKLMNRATDLDRFLRGVRCVQERKITAGIDLIAGLPGDDLAGFKRSVDFVADNRLQDDIQVFPLAVLPGTAYRLNRRRLGLRFEPHPPYPVVATATFSAEDLLEAFDYAESRFDVCLYPMPDLNIAWRTGGKQRSEADADIRVTLDHQPLITKVILHVPRDLTEIQHLAGQLTHPYQVHFGPQLTDQRYIAAVLECVSAANPHTPFEVVFIEPPQPPPTDRLLAHIKIERPHYLDLDQRYLFPRPGNRAVLFTLVTQKRRLKFAGEMERKVFWWQRRRLPTLAELESFSDCDGLLIDTPTDQGGMVAWQNRFAARARDCLHIGFADIALQLRWTEMTNADDYYPGAFNGWAR